MDNYIEIISIFYKDLDREYTIRQVSKQIKKSYAYTNIRCRELIYQGILSKKVVGASILCRLNYKSDKTLGLLVLKSILEKTAELEKDKKNENEKKFVEDATEVERSLKEFSDSIFFAQNKFHIICKNEMELNQKLSSLDLKHGFAVYDKNSFKQYVKQQGLQEVIIIYGFENFWRVIADGI
ncbi:TPA: hypothetical protein HA246_04935 [Candidatus Woesearchaeota archaeon]|nr:hypothetical protein [Candidatus Woesearchaeota archaeon]